MCCYLHRDVEAVGVCRSCLKGVCPTCATLMERGSLACSQECSTKIVDNEKWIEAIRSAKGQHRVNIWLTPAFLVGMGILFLAFGVYRDGFSFNFATTMGAASSSMA